MGALIVVGLLFGVGGLVASIGLILIFEAFLRQQLEAIVETLLSRARFLTSPVAVPPGIFEAFGPLVPASLTIDDLIATGTLATPTAPWALLPIIPPKLPVLPTPIGELERGRETGEPETGTSAAGW